MPSLIQNYRPALAVQLLHVALCVVWNGIGLAQRAGGVQTIGPTASFGAIAIVLLFGAGLVVFLGRGKEIPYLLLSPLGLLLAGAAIAGAFTKDPASWPSEFWRWAGVAVNAFGVIGFLLALGTFIRRQSTRSIPSSP
jgi:hypothetical protein